MKKILSLSVLLLVGLTTTTFAAMLPPSTLEQDKKDANTSTAFRNLSPHSSPQSDKSKKDKKIDSPSAQRRRIAQVVVIDQSNVTVVEEGKGLEVISRGSLTPPMVYRSHHNYRTLSAALEDIESKTSNSASTISSRSSSGMQSPVFMAMSPILTPSSMTTRVQTPSSPETDDGKNTKRTVIYVDDENTNRKIVKMQVGGISKKWEVIVATCGSEAIKIIYTRLKNNLPIDAILMDYNMLFLNGAKTTTLIRSLTALTHAQLPIIGFTTDTSKDTVAACLRAGMNKVVKKPAPKNVLEAELKTAFQTRDEAILAQMYQTGQPVECLADQGDGVECLLETIEKIDHIKSDDKDSNHIAPSTDNVSYLIGVTDPNVTESKKSSAANDYPTTPAHLNRDSVKQ